MKLIQEAKLIDSEEGDRIEYKNNFLEDTSLLDNTYDFITVLRAWHWFGSKKPHFGMVVLMDREGGV